MKRGYVTGIKKERRQTQKSRDRYTALAQALAAELARKYPEQKHQ